MFKRVVSLLLVLVMMTGMIPVPAGAAETDLDTGNLSVESNNSLGSLLSDEIEQYQAEEKSGVRDVRFVAAFENDFHQLATSGNYENLYLDLFRASPADIDRPAHRFLREAQKEYPYLKIETANPLIRKLRTIKQPCEIEALKKATEITRDGILAMMKASKPGMFEYQYKAEYDYALLRYKHNKMESKLKNIKKDF